MGTVLVVLILAVIVGLIIFSMVKDRRRGKNSCGCGCKNCASAGLCHSRTAYKK